MSRLSRLFLFVAGSAIAAIVPLTNTAEAASLITCDQPVFINQTVSSNMTFTCTARIETSSTSSGLFSALVNGQFKLLSTTTAPPATASCSRRLNVLMCNGRETYVVTMQLGLKTSSMCGTKVALSGVVGSGNSRRWLTANIVFPSCSQRASSSSRSSSLISTSSASSVSSRSSSSAGNLPPVSPSSSSKSSSSSGLNPSNTPPGYFSSSSKSSSSAAALPPNTPPPTNPTPYIPSGILRFSLGNVFSQNNASASNQQTRRNINCPTGYVATRVGYKDYGNTDAASGFTLECRKLRIDGTLGDSTGFLANPDIDLVSAAFGYSPCTEKQGMLGLAMKYVQTTQTVDGAAAGCSSFNPGGQTIWEGPAVTNGDLASNTNPTFIQSCPSGSFLTGLGYFWAAGTQTVGGITYINCAPLKVTNLTQCNDGIDNDNNGQIDFPNDSKCISETDMTEGNPAPASTTNLFVTQDSSATRSRQYLGGTQGPDIFKLLFRADVGQDIDVTNLRFTSMGNSAVSIDRLELYTEGANSPLAAATIGGCENDDVVSNVNGTTVATFCASLTQRQLIVTKGTTVSILVKPRLKSDQDGGIDGQQIQFFLAKNNDAKRAIQARIDTTGTVLESNDNDTTAEGEVFVGTNVAGPNADIIGKKNVVVMAKIIQISNANPDADHTILFTGGPSVSDLGQFKFVAAPNSNSKNGLNKVGLDTIIFTVDAPNMLLDPTKFFVYNKANSTQTKNCTTLRMDGSVVTASKIEGSFLVRCTDILNSSVILIIDQGSDRTFVLQGTLLPPDIVSGSLPPASLQVSLTDFSSMDNPNSHIIWKSGDSSATNATFNWIEYPSDAIRSTLYDR